MRRRELLTLLGAGVIAPTAFRPRSLRAQQSPRVPRIGLIANAPLPPIDGLHRKLREFGYVDGTNLVVETRYARGVEDRYSGFAAELAALPVDLLVAWGTPAALAAKGATTKIPIVFVAGDAVNTGIVSNLSRPDANITGFIAVNVEIEEKRLELLKEAVPRAARIAVLVNGLNPLNRVNLETARRAAAKLSLTLEAFDAHSGAEIEAVLRSLAASRPDAALVGSDIFLMSERRRIAAAMESSRIPAIYPFREYADSGAFMIYGANISILFEQVASYVDRLLRGESPVNLPIQQATAFELIVNLKVAARLGLTLSPVMLSRADEVIE